MQTPRSRGRALRAVGLLLAIGLMLPAACAPQAPVVQGKVVTVAPGALRVQDETRPEAEPLALDTTTAEIGAPPDAGDIVRVVYREEGGVRRALAVMNLTRQEHTQGR